MTDLWHRLFCENTGTKSIARSNGCSAIYTVKVEFFERLELMSINGKRLHEDIRGINLSKPLPDAAVQTIGSDGRCVIKDRKNQPGSRRKNRIIRGGNPEARKAGAEGEQHRQNQRQCDDAFHGGLLLYFWAAAQVAYHHFIQTIQKIHFAHKHKSEELLFALMPLHFLRKSDTIRSENMNCGMPRGAGTPHDPVRVTLTTRHSDTHHGLMISGQQGNGSTGCAAHWHM